MEAKDTVMSDEELTKAVRGEWNAEHLRVAQVQAEISFRAGQEAEMDGKKMGTNPYYLKDTDGDYYNKYPEFQIWEEGRQAGIKEVGKWLEAHLVEPWERLDEPATFRFTLLELLKLRDAGKIPNSRAGE